MTTYSDTICVEIDSDLSIEGDGVYESVTLSVEQDVQVEVSILDHEEEDSIEGLGAALEVDFDHSNNYDGSVVEVRVLVNKERLIALAKEWSVDEFSVAEAACVLSVPVLDDYPVPKNAAEERFQQLELD